MTKTLKKILSNVIAFVSAITILFGNIHPAFASEIDSSAMFPNLNGNYITLYFYSYDVIENNIAKILVYKNAQCTERDPNVNEYIDIIHDQCRIIAISKENNSILVEYPVANGGVKQRWIKMSYVTTYSYPVALRSPGNFTTYKFPKKHDKYIFGRISEREPILPLRTRNGFTEILYKVDGTNNYKIAWIEGQFA